MPPFLPKPKIMVFFTTFRCNLHCAMCYIWVKQKQSIELSIDEIKYIFSHRLINNNLEIINITGGEPTLREDLVEIIKIILEKCIYLKRIDISTNGVNTTQIIDQFERILAILLLTNVKLTVSISLDGVGEVHERVRQTQGVFDNIEKTIDGLKELMTLYPFFNLGFNMTINKLNYNAVEEVREYAKEKGIGLTFTLSSLSEIGVESIRFREKFEMNQDQKEKVARFLEKLSYTGELDYRYFRFLLSWLLTGRRQGGCAFRKGGSLLLEPNGDMYLCGNYKEFRIDNLLDVPLGDRIIFKRSDFNKKYKLRCETCNSNCYIDEA